MNKNKGFTLIEMMVVIAIIGFLSAAILVAVQNARQKARESQIIKNVQEAAGIAESYYNAGTAVYASPETDAQWINLEKSSMRLGAVDATAVNDALKWGNAAGGSLNVFVVWGPLLSPNKYFCVDASGQSKIIAAEPVANAVACP